jgi:NAD(P)-dependent dehydrogenase (short-subunit alcohol dehydrogenase family)
MTSARRCSRARAGPAGAPCRVGQPEDIANAVLFLATAFFATGSTVRVAIA